MITALLTLCVVLLAAVLVVLVGVIRRLRLHEALLAGNSGGSAPRTRPASTIPDFSERATSGQAVSREFLLERAREHGSVRVVFLSSACEGCAQSAAWLVNELDARRESAANTAVIVFDDASDPRQLLDVLGNRMITLVRPVGDHLIGAFGVAGTPTLHEFSADGVLMNSRPVMDGAGGSPAHA